MFLFVALFQTIQIHFGAGSCVFSTWQFHFFPFYLLRTVFVNLIGCPNATQMPFIRINGIYRCEIAAVTVVWKEVFCNEKYIECNY